MSVRIARLGELQPGQTKKFLLDCEGHEVEGFLLNYAGQHHAYVNRCRHVPMSLDWVENQFFTTDGSYLLCPTHGAFYLPDTGECVAGPPCGRFLIPVPLVERDGIVLARCPTVEE